MGGSAKRPTFNFGPLSVSVGEDGKPVRSYGASTTADLKPDGSQKMLADRLAEARGKSLRELQSPMAVVEETPSSGGIYDRLDAIKGQRLGGK